MPRSLRFGLVCMTVMGLLLSTAQIDVAASAGARLEGVLVGVDGRPAADHRVTLVDGGGAEVGTTRTDDDGVYSFRGLAEGDYGVMVEGPSGELGGSPGESLRLGGDQLARHDMRLMEADAETAAMLQANYGVKQNYAGMTIAEKTWLWVVVGVVGGLTMFLVLDDDDERRASDFE